MRKLYTISMLFVICLAFITGCEKDTTGIDTSDETGNLKIWLTDAPAVYDSVKIYFSEVSAHLDSQWIVVPIETMGVDLLDWTNGNAMILGSADVPAGKYTQIRIKIDTAEIGVDGQVYPLDVPSGAKTGLKLGPQFTINPGATYELVVDFDVNKSIVTMGPKHNPIGYKLKPRLRIISKAITGSISGIVRNYQDLPVAYAIQNTDTVNSTIIDQTNGQFMLSFLSEGIYTVFIRDTAGLSFLKNDTTVVAGINTNLDSLSLQ